MTAALNTLFQRDIARVQQEIELYKTEAAIWQKTPGISNPAGNLCLHLAGNLHTYIGAALAGSGYVRQRALEFSLTDVPRAELLEQLESVKPLVEKGLLSLTADDMKKDFPVLISDKPTPTDGTLLHLLAHLSYHLGQINYHRRLLDK